MINEVTEIVMLDFPFKNYALTQKTHLSPYEKFVREAPACLNSSVITLIGRPLYTKTAVPQLGHLNTMEEIGPPVAGAQYKGIQLQRQGGHVYHNREQSQSLTCTGLRHW